jgi:uncharacterized protein (TIGR02466 family)
MHTKLQVSADISLLFPTPLLTRRHPQHQALNASLSSYILECAAREPGIGRSIRFGWHSKNDFLNRDRPALKALRAWIAGAVRDMNRFALGEGGERFQPVLTTSWANVIGEGGYHKLHAHRNNAWAGVYYVSAPAVTGESDAGYIEFPDPRGAAAMITPDHSGLALNPVSIQPVEGTLLIFPAWMQHFVNPYRGSGQRLTIAFNFVLVKPAAPTVIAGAANPAT